MDRTVDYTKVVDMLVDAARELNGETLCRRSETAAASAASAASAADAASAAGASRASGNNEAAFDAALRFAQIQLEASNRSSGVEYVDAPKPGVSDATRQAFVEDTRPKSQK